MKKDMSNGKKKRVREEDQHRRAETAETKQKARKKETIASYGGAEGGGRLT